MNQVDILGVFAHPDDLELCVAGTMLRMKHLGYRTAALDATRGEMGTRGTPETRAAEAIAGADILQLDGRDNLDLTDGHILGTDQERTLLVRALRRLKPKLILTHQIDDPHPDHNALAHIVRAGARLASMKNYDPETGDQKIDVPRIAHNIFSRRTEPSFIVDISEYLETKMDAIRAYQSQFHDPDSEEPETRLSTKGFLNEIENRSRYFGSLIGVEAGEPFFIREALNVWDPVELLSRPMNLYS